MKGRPGRQVAGGIKNKREKKEGKKMRKGKGVRCAGREKEKKRN